MTILGDMPQAELSLGDFEDVMEGAKGAMGHPMGGRVCDEWDNSRALRMLTMMKL